MPGKSRSRWALDELLEEDELEVLAGRSRDRDEPREHAGTLTRAKAAFFSFFSESSTASDRERFDTNGNGWAGSKARGVSTG